MPWGPADFAVDQFFETVFPGYRTAAMDDERGHLVPTPYGDTVDTLLSDALPSVLAQSVPPSLCNTPLLMHTHTHTHTPTPTPAVVSGWSASCPASAVRPHPTRASRTQAHPATETCATPFDDDTT